MSDWPSQDSCRNSVQPPLLGISRTYRPTDPTSSTYITSNPQLPLIHSNAVAFRSHITNIPVFPAVRAAHQPIPLANLLESQFQDEGPGYIYSQSYGRPYYPNNSALEGMSGQYVHHTYSSNTSQAISLPIASSDVATRHHRLDFYSSQLPAPQHPITEARPRDRLEPIPTQPQSEGIRKQKRKFTGAEYNNVVEKVAGRQFKCCRCGWIGNRADRAEGHANGHLGKTPYPCSGGCGVTACPLSFKSQNDCETHMKRSRATKAQCGRCHKYILARNMQRHVVKNCGNNDGLKT